MAFPSEVHPQYLPSLDPFKDEAEDDRTEDVELDSIFELDGHGNVQPRLADRARAVGAAREKFFI